MYMYLHSPTTHEGAHVHMLFQSIQNQVGDHLQPLLVRRLRQFLGQSHSLDTVFARQEAGLFQSLRLVHQLERLLYVALLLKPSHDHRIQFRELEKTVRQEHR